MKRTRIERLIVLLVLSSLLLTSAVRPAQSPKGPKGPSAAELRTSEKPTAVFGPAAATDGSQSAAASTGRISVADQRLHARAAEAYGKLPLSFEANLGQADSRTKFLSRSGGYGIFLSATDADFFLSYPSRGKNPGKAPVARKEPPAQTSVVRMSLSGANPAPKMQGLDELPGKSNYLIGNDREKWHTNIPNYAKVKYEDVYPGVDMVYYGDRRQLEYDFVVAPHADSGAIRLAFKGAQQTLIDARGDLVLKTADGELRQRKPIVYQETNGAKQYVAGRYLLTANGEVGFAIGKYDTSRPLIIDPVFVYSTYLGGSQEDVSYGIAVDAEGDCYVTGETFSSNFPTANPLQPVLRGQDIFVAKLNPSGTALLYSTYIGGSGSEVGYSIAVDAANSAYVTGYTKSNNFPTANALQPVNRGGADAFLLKLNPTGSALVYSTYLGGSAAGSGDGDFGYAIALDSLANAYITGETNSIDFPTVNALQPNKGGGRDAFVAKVNAAGSALVYSTYLGGSAYEHSGINVDSNSTKPGNRIAVDVTGSAVVIGYTWSTDFPTVNAIQPTNRGHGDVFVSKLNPSGSALVFSTYLGGSGNDLAYGVALDSSNSIYLTGNTTSGNFPTMNALQPAIAGFEEAFVTKINAAGTALVYSTYLGGSSRDSAWGIAVDASGNCYVIGDTTSTNFPTGNLLQPGYGGGTDVFVSKLNAAGSALVYSSFVGGASADFGTAITADSAGNVFVAGYTISTDFPTTNPLQPANRGIYDVFVSKIDSVVFSVVVIVSNKGGNNGQLSATIVGGGFQPGATVKLKASNQPDIPGTNLIMDGSSLVTATFDLRGATPGLRDVVVTLLDGSTATLRDGFTIEEGGRPELWLNASGRARIARGRDMIYRMSFGNSGHVDANNVIVWVAVPEGVTAKADVPYLEELGAQTVPPVSRDGYAYTWIYLEKLSGNSSESFDFHLLSPELGPIDIRGGILEGTEMLQSMLSQPSSLAGPGGETKSNLQAVTHFQLVTQSPLEDPPPPLLKGQLVFRLSGSGARTGHVGIYDGNGHVIDLYPPPGTLFVSVAEYRSTDFATWKSEGGATYVGSFLPPGVSTNVAADAAEKAKSFVGGSTPFLAPPVLGFSDCVSFMNDAYRSAGHIVPWPDWWAPGAIYSAVSGKFWPEKSIWLFLSDFTLLIDSLHFGQVLAARAFSMPIQVLGSMDPNDKAGPAGYGPLRYQKGDQPYDYVVYYENLSSATAPAQEIVIADQLDPTKFDLSTFRLGSMVFGSHQIEPPPGLSAFATNVDLRPELDLIVRITVSLDQSSGNVVWRFASFEPATGQPPTDPLIGFLPPNINAPEGEGRVTFTVSPKPGLLTGAEVQNQASIVFDTNAAILTPTFSNTIDNSTPTSHVLPLPTTQSSESFNVEWTGIDTGSGIKDYTIFVSENGGPYTPWLSNVTVTQSTFAGQTGKSYSFFSIARDLTGNLENTKTTAEATTMVAANADLSITNDGSPGAVVTGSNVTYTITVTNYGPGAASSVAVTDTLPAASTFVSCSATGGQVCGGSGNSRAVNFPTLAPNSSETITIVATLNCAVVDGTQISNIAMVGSPTADPNQNNNTATANISASNPPPSIACPANIVQPNDPGAGSALVNYALPSAADNCPSITVNCSRQSGGTFPVGATPVTCTATDSAGSQSSCSFTVTVSDTEAPRITTCATNKTLSANGNNQIPLPNLTGEIVATDNSTPPAALTITQSPAAGTMVGLGTTLVTISVRDAANNAATCIAMVSISGFSLRDFVVFSWEHTVLHANAKVSSGSVGANTSQRDPNGPPDDKEEVEIGEHVLMVQAGSRVAGDTLRLRVNSQVQVAFFNELLNARGEILGSRFTPVTLPLVKFPVLPPIAPGTQDIEVQTNQTKTLAPGRYRKITVKNRGTLILTGGIYELSSLDIRQDTNVLFQGPAEVRVKNEFDTDARTYIGPGASAPSLSASQIVFYAEGTDDRGRHHDEDEDLTPTVVQIGQRNTVRANIYAPNGTVWLKGNTKATGAFVGKRARIGVGVELRLASAF